MKARLAAVLCLASILAGCAQLRLAQIVEDGDRASRLPQSDQIAAVEEARRTYATRTSDESRVRLALLLSLAARPLRDDNLAALLLEPYSSTGTPLDPVQRFAALLRMQLVERTADKAESAQLTEQLDAGRKRLEQLQSQLEAERDRLTSLEAQARKAADLVVYARDIPNLPLPDQQREFYDAERAYMQAPSEESGVRFALLLSLPGAPFQDDARAAGVLAPFAAQGEALTPVRQLAALLQLQAGSRLREKRRTAQLQERLDALREIERSLIKRRQTE